MLLSVWHNHALSPNAVECFFLHFIVEVVSASYNHRFGRFVCVCVSMCCYLRRTIVLTKRGMTKSIWLKWKKVAFSRRHSMARVLHLLHRAWGGPNEITGLMRKIEALFRCVWSGELFRCMWVYVCVWSLIGSTNTDPFQMEPVAYQVICDAQANVPDISS